MGRKEKRGRSAAATNADAAELAERLMTGALQLVRRSRTERGAAGISQVRRAALARLVEGGPLPVTALAAAEGVTAPSMTRLVSALEADGLVERRRSAEDRRVVFVHPTRAGRMVARAGRERDGGVLAQRIAALSRDERAALARAADLIGRIVDEDPAS